MPLDTYIIREDARVARAHGAPEGYRVTRYKAQERMESMDVSPNSSQLSPAVQKRLKLIDRYKRDGKPSVGVYWFEADGSVLGSGIHAEPINDDPTWAKSIRGIDRIINGTLYIWVGPKLIPIKTPPKFDTAAEFEIFIKNLWGKNRADAQDWLIANAGPSLSGLGLVLLSGADLDSTAEPGSLLMAGAGGSLTAYGAIYHSGTVLSPTGGGA